MITQVYSRRLKRKVYRLDAKPTHGKTFRKFFLRRSDTEAVAYKMNHDAVITVRVAGKFRSRAATLSDLAKKFADEIGNPREKKELDESADFCLLLTPGTCVDEVTKAVARDRSTRDLRMG